MKKVLIPILFIILSFTSCETINEDKIAEEHFNLIVSYLQNKDTENLKNMFCEVSRQSPTLESEIENAFDFFDSKIISYDILVSSSEGEYGDFKKLFIHPHIVDITLENGKKFTMIYYEYLENTSYKDKIGISKISIYDETNNDKEYIIGKFLD
jgi:hypothetical protein